MAPRVTVQDLRNEARARLKECSGGKTIGRMNKKQVLQLLDCFDDIALAREYRQQEEERKMEIIRHEQMHRQHAQEQQFKTAWAANRAKQLNSSGIMFG